MSGNFFIVATPIGNLEDISARAKKTLEQVDIILAEDTRRTRNLLSYLGIHKQVESFHQHNQSQKIPKILEWLTAGKNLALVTDAGTPAVSDPGANLIRDCLLKGIKVIPIPGPSAITTALSASGFPSDRFLFLGFVPANASERKTLLQKFKDFPETMVLFEAPHRIQKTLKDLLEIFGNRKACLCREMTKVYEEIKFSDLSYILEYLSNQTPRGEITLIIAGSEKQSSEQISGQEINLDEMIKNKLNQGKSIRDIVSELSQNTDFPKNLIYKKILQLKKAQM